MKKLKLAGVLLLFVLSLGVLGVRLWMRHEKALANKAAAVKLARENAPNHWAVEQRARLKAQADARPVSVDKRSVRPQQAPRAARSGRASRRNVRSAQVADRRLPRGVTIETSGPSGPNPPAIKMPTLTSVAEPATLIGHDGAVTALAFSPDGSLLASGGDDHTVRLWDVKSGTEVRTLQEHAASVISAAFSPDGKLLATGDFSGLTLVWDVATMKVRARLQCRMPAEVVAFADGGAEVATTSARGLKVWNAASGKLVGEVPVDGEVAKLAMSPNGAYLAAALDPARIVVWDSQWRPVTRKDRVNMVDNTVMPIEPVQWLTFIHKDKIAWGDGYCTWESRVGTADDGVVRWFATPAGVAVGDGAYLLLVSRLKESVVATPGASLPAYAVMLGKDPLLMTASANGKAVAWTEDITAGDDSAKGPIRLYRAQQVAALQANAAAITKLVADAVARNDQAAIPPPYGGGYMGPPSIAWR